MHNSTPSEIAYAGGNSSSDADENYRVRDSGSRNSGRISIGSARLNFSPANSLPSTPSRWSPNSLSSASSMSLNGYTGEVKKIRKPGRRAAWHGISRKVGLTALIGCFFLMNWWMISRIQETGSSRGDIKLRMLRANSSTVFIREELHKLGRGKKPQKTSFARLLAKAAHALAEGESKPEPKDLWFEHVRSSSWTPCAHQRNWTHSEGKNGYIMVTANGGINQQRVAVCNAVAVARLLNATLVLPKFMYSSVWKDAR